MNNNNNNNGSTVTNNYAPQRSNSMLPQCLSRYSNLIPKLVNGLFIAMAVCNFFLLISVGGASVLPDLGINTLLSALLLCFQNGISWYILNNSRLPYSMQAIPTSDFMVGTVLGITIGGAILSFELSQYYGRVANCITIATKQYTYQCDHRGKMLTIWFWAGMIFWLELVTAIMIGIGREEITFQSQSQQYEDIGLTMDVNNTFQGSNARFTLPDSSLFSSWRQGGQHQPIGEAQLPQSKQGDDTQSFKGTQALLPDAHITSV